VPLSIQGKPVNFSFLEHFFIVNFGRLSGQQASFASVRVHSEYGASSNRMFTNQHAACSPTNTACTGKDTSRKRGNSSNLNALAVDSNTYPNIPMLLLA